MATITRFEELEIWQLALAQMQDFVMLVEITPLAKDFKLKNQMNASSGSMMDCFAEGFERSGLLLQNTAFKEQRYKKEKSSIQPQTSNPKPQSPILKPQTL